MKSEKRKIAIVSDKDKYFEANDVFLEFKRKAELGEDIPNDLAKEFLSVFTEEKQFERRLAIIQYDRLIYSVLKRFASDPYYQFKPKKSLDQNIRWLLSMLFGDLLFEMKDHPGLILPTEDEDIERKRRQIIRICYTSLNKYLDQVSTVRYKPYQKKLYKIQVIIGYILWELGFPVSPVVDEYRKEPVEDHPRNKELYEAIRNDMKRHKKEGTSD